MNRRLTIKFLVFIFCSSICVTQDFDPSVFPYTNKKDCKFPFTYQDNDYMDCTTDGDNGDIPWCAIEDGEQAIYSTCIDFGKSLLKCLPSFTMPDGKVYTDCGYLSSAALYKQCKTNHPVYKYRYCTDALSNSTKTSVGRRADCDQKYSKLSPYHTMCYGPSPYGLAVPINATEKQALLDIHNKYRASVSSKYMFQLYWDDELALMAQARSNMCIFAHDLAANRLSPLYNWKNGQNMVMSSETRSTLASLIDIMLSSEKPNFRYGDTCDPGEDTCLHYTQALISNLTRIGCARTDCIYPFRVDRYLTCNFIQSQYEDNYQTPYIRSKIPAADCPAKNKSGLCDCGPMICRYDLGQYLEPNTCKCRTPLIKRSIDDLDLNDHELMKRDDATMDSHTGQKGSHKSGKRPVKVKKPFVVKRSTEKLDSNERELMNYESKTMNLLTGQIGPKHVHKRDLKNKTRKVDMGKENTRKKIKLDHKN